MLRFSPLLIGMVALACYGAAEGVWTDRWRASASMDEAVAKLKGIPVTIGDWVAQEQELDAETLAVGDIRGYVMRQYTRQGSNQSLNVLVVCGRPGPIAVHTPEVCYGGAGHSQDKPAKRVAVGAAKFWTAQFSQNDAPVPEKLGIYWAWNATGAWEAVDRPRWVYARYPVLYKLYVVRNIGANPGKDLQEDDYTPKFLEVFLPELQRCLFGGS